MMATSREPEDWSERRREALLKTVKDLYRDEPRLPPAGAIRRVLSRIRARVLDFFFERGLETAGRQYELEHFHSERTAYEPSGWLYLRRALRKRDVKPTDVFVDFGSGKGRVVFQAARYPFARVVGVEISEALNEVARRNIGRNRHRLVCQDVALVTADAAEFEVPDDMTVAYFFYPFAGTTFERVLDNIVASLDRRPRRVKLIYACPGEEKSIARTGRFQLVQRSQGALRSYIPRRISVYESL
jgi:SAM-dependent methyltransferase